MYYVSRHKTGKIGITDTKDGVEEFLTYDQVLDLLMKGIEIKGATLEWVYYKTRPPKPIVHTSVYNYVKDGEQAKNVLLGNYSYITNDAGILTSFVIVGDVTRDIVLGDFCKGLGSRCFQNPKGGHVYLIFDDRIESVDPFTFSDMYHGTVKLDFTNVHNQVLLTKLYKYSARVSSAWHDNYDWIIDNPDRRPSYLGEFLLMYKRQLTYELTPAQTQFIVSRNLKKLRQLVPTDVNKVKLNTQDFDKRMGIEEGKKPATAVLQRVVAFGNDIKSMWYLVQDGFDWFKTRVKDIEVDGSFAVYCFSFTGLSLANSEMMFQLMKYGNEVGGNLMRIYYNYCRAALAIMIKAYNANVHYLNEYGFNLREIRVKAV